MVADFVAFDGRREWSPGGIVDCCLSLAEWAIWLGYDDPAEKFRGAYQAGAGQEAILAANGGAVSIVERQVAAIGGAVIDAPQIGCIGVVGSPDNVRRQFGVIYGADGWLTRTPTGWHGIAAMALGIWEI